MGSTGPSASEPVRSSRPRRRGRARGHRAAGPRQAGRRPARHDRRRGPRRGPRAAASRTSATRPSSEQVMQTSSVQSALASPVLEETGVLEHDVGQLPQQVVQQDEVARARRNGGSSTSSQTTWSARVTAAARGRTAPSQRLVRPQASARVRGRRRRIVRGANTPAGGLRRASSRDGLGWAAGAASTYTAGNARLPTMTGWTNSTATWRAWAGHAGRRTTWWRRRRSGGPGTVRPRPGPRRLRPGLRGCGRGAARRWRAILHDRSCSPATIAVAGVAPAAAARGAATAACPSARPTVVRWEWRWVRTVKPLAWSCARANPSNKAFWKTPPLSATIRCPLAARTGSAASTMARATAAWNPAAMAPVSTPAAGRRSTRGARGRGPAGRRSGRSGTGGTPRLARQRLFGRPLQLAWRPAPRSRRGGARRAASSPRRRGGPCSTSARSRPAVELARQHGPLLGRQCAHRRQVVAHSMPPPTGGPAPSGRAGGRPRRHRVAARGARWPTRSKPS